MCVQLDSKVMRKRTNKKGIPSNFHEFWSEEVHCKKYPPKKKTLMFKCNNLTSSKEQQSITFWSWCSTKHFKVPIITLSSSHTLIFGKKDFPTMSKTAEFVKKTQGILGLKKWVFHLGPQKHMKGWWSKIINSE
jgi:hypothetical protein